LSRPHFQIRDLYIFTLPTLEVENQTGSGQSVCTYVGSQFSVLRICITSFSDRRSTWYSLVMSRRFSSHFSFGIFRLRFRVCRIMATASQLSGDMLFSTVLCTIRRGRRVVEGIDSVG
jgi:hypothetical protein